MKRIILFGMAFVMMLLSLGGCYLGHDGYDRGDRHDRDGGHEDRH